MIKAPKSVAVVGGGTAGFISALILKKKFPSLRISIIHSSKIGIIGVGEWSTEHWKTFLNFLDIDHREVFKECDSTLKCGIMFKDWADEDYLHSVQTEYNQKFGQYSHVYANLIGNGYNSKDLSSGLSWKGQINRWFIDNPDWCPTSQFHFNTNKLNAWLNKLAHKFDIEVFDDEIVDFEIKEDGDIGALYGRKKKYNYDFYIDSTGFKKLLISKLGAKWQSYSKYLKMKSAIVFPTADEENYNNYTLAKAMDYGWMFRIPVWGRYGNGYIYDSDYIDEHQAKLEAEKYLGYEVEVAKKLEFDPGGLDRVWINNCVAIGLSASFVEPLEASSIGTSIQQAFSLMNRLINYDQTVIDMYNKDCTSILENVRDFVALHYYTNKDSSQFWKDIKNIPIPEKLKERLDLWKHRLPVSADFNSDSRYILFTEDHHIMVLHGIGHFNTDSIKREFDMQDMKLKVESDSIIAHNRLQHDTVPRISHKEFIKYFR
jgi:tryptophan halogenase